ncbi:DUF3040 domain-containing protein [Actinophytocola sediminis]
MLSHDEHQQLRAIEQWLETDDPTLARLLRAHQSPPRPHERQSVRLAVDVAGGLFFTLGALTATAVLILLGVILIAGGVAMHLATRPRPPEQLP